MNRRDFLSAGVRATAAFAPWPSLTTTAAREPLALVTADTEGHVAVVSLAGGRVRRRIATLDGPRSIQRGAGGAVVVGHSAAGAVTLLDGRTLRVRRVLRGFAAPRYTVFSPDGRHAFVSDGDAGELATIDLLRGRVVNREPIGPGARHLTINPQGTRIWLALGSAAPLIAVVDVTNPRRPRIVRSVHPPFLAHDVGFSPSGRRVWVTAAGVHRMAVYGADGGHQLTLAADSAPQHVTFARGRAYVASGTGRSVRVHALSDGRLQRAVRVPLGSYNVQAAGTRILTPSLDVGTLTVLDRAGRVRASVRAAAHAHDVCLA